MFTLVRDGEVWAPEAVGRKEILICGERILAMGEGLAPKAEALGRVEVLDASGKFVVPGFIDQHIHFLGGGDFEGPLGRVPELHLSMITRGGVTTAVGCLGIDMDFKNLHGLLVKAHELERSGLTTYIYTGSFRIPSVCLTSSVRADLVLIDKVLGVKVALSEDTRIGLHNAPPSILHRELVHIIRTNSLKLSEALPLVTTNVARVLGIHARKGSLQPGKDADLVCLNGDLLAGVLVPFWSSILVRTFAWLVILGKNGLVNQALTALGILSQPIPLIHSCC